MFSQQPATTSLNNIKQLISVTEKFCVFFDVRTKFFNTIVTSIKATFKIQADVDFMAKCEIRSRVNRRNPNLHPQGTDSFRIIYRTTRTQLHS